MSIKFIIYKLYGFGDIRIGFYMNLGQKGLDNRDSKVIWGDTRDYKFYMLLLKVLGVKGSKYLELYYML